MTVETTDRLIAPHGGTLVDRTGDAPEDLDSLEVVTLTSRELSDLDMLASGALSPLEGFMGKADYDRVVEEMHLASGLPWALPVCLAVDSAPSGDRVALADESGRALAILEVEETYEYDREHEAEHCFRTTDEAHPGVARLFAQKPLYLAGRVTVFERATAEFPELARDPAETRRIFAERGWKRVVGFQTRNPIHRAHEYLTKVALETVDGLLVHPLVGDTKSDDVPVDVRVDCYTTLLDGYYPSDRVLLSAFPAAMRYAGPREAVWHAICRKNYGCSHFIVGRDHAGVGDYYGTYDAQLIFDEFAPHELDIEPMFFEHTFWCNVCGSMASTKSCPHGPEDRVFLSGTKVREMLGEGDVPPVEFTRPEVAKVLIDAYRATEIPRSYVDWKLTVAGLFTGLLVGMTGMGGGSLMTPILVFLFGIPPSTAIGTDIAHGAVFKSVGAVQHRRMGNVRARLAGWMLIGSVPASLLGVWLNVQLTERYGDEAKSVMGQVLGAALLFGAVGLIAKSLVQTGGPAGDPDWELTKRDKVAAIVIGLLGGFIVGLTSVGSGVFFGLTLLVVFPLRAHKVVGTDIFHAAILLYVAGAAHWAAGNIDFGILFWLLLGSIPGRADRRSADLVVPRAATSDAPRRCSRPRGDQALERSLRRHDHRRRALGRRGGAPRLARAPQLDSLRARPRRNRRHVRG